MYLDLDSYATYITAYKTYIFDTAKIMVREMGSSVTDESLTAAVEDIFLLETGIAKVRPIYEKFM